MAPPDPTSPTPSDPSPKDGRGTPGGTPGGSAGRGRPGSRGSTGPSAAAFAGVGIQLGLTLTLSALGGLWLDRRLGTSPWLLLLLVLVGAAAGFYSIYRRVIGSGSGRSARDRDA